MKIFFELVLIITFIGNATAADVYVERKYQIHIDGTIRSGDAERVAKLLTQMNVVSTFRVKSPGGSVLEAIKIASLINGLKASLVIKKGEVCASSCFFLFINGYHRFAMPFRTPEAMQAGRGKGYMYVGIHRPYLSSEDEVYATSVEKQAQLMAEVKTYLRDRSVPEYLISEMMSRPSNEIYWLQEKDLDAIGEHDAGVEEVLIKECKYSRDDWKLSDAEVDQKFECYSDVFDRVFQPQQYAFIAKLKTGWRPWKK